MTANRCWFIWVLIYIWIWQCFLMSFMFKLGDQVNWLVSLKWGGLNQSVKELIRTKRWSFCKWREFFLSGDLQIGTLASTFSVLLRLYPVLTKILFGHATSDYVEVDMVYLGHGISPEIFSTCMRWWHTSPPSPYVLPGVVVITATSYCLLWMKKPQALVYW